MIRDEAHQAVIAAMRAYDVAARESEEALLRLKELRSAAEHAGRELRKAQDELDDLLRSEAGIEPAGVGLNRTVA